MKVFLFTSFLYLFSFLMYSQVGIGTTNPSSAAVLDISSSSNGIRYGGLMPPRVPSQFQRDAIPINSADTGLLVFVQDSATFQIWNGLYWETIYTLATQAITLAVQDFDTNINWSYSLNQAVYNTNNDIWDIVTTLGPNTSEIDIVSGYFLGCRDLDNPITGTNFIHEIAFVNVDISSIVNARVAFDFDVFEFDNGDDVQYEVFHDEVSQGIVTFVNGSGDLTVEGTITINIPNSVTNFRFNLGVSQNGENDFAGFDNFRVYGE
ncbi:MAG: hypothetical protein ACI840_000225 [Ulvibacter sp.]|jgi:hypothetical protein